MKNAIQNIAVGVVAILSLTLALNGCNDDKKTEQQKFQPDSYYENKSVQELESLCESNDFKACHKAGANLCSLQSKNQAIQCLLFLFSYPLLQKYLQEWLNFL